MISAYNGAEALLYDRKNMTYKELSEKFRAKWKLDEGTVKQKEEKFMEHIRSLLWRISADPEDDHGIQEGMRSTYDSTTILHEVQEIIDDYNEIYHIVNVTTCWKHDDRFDPNNEIEED